MFKYYRDLSETQQGLILLLTGTIVLLHTLGIVQWGLDAVIVIVAVAMIISGFIKIKGMQKVQKILDKKNSD